MQPVDPLELWDSAPFEPEVRDNKLYARGASDDKGQVFMHIKAVEALMKESGSLPVNVKFLIEGEEEIGSPSLESYIIDNKDKLSADVIVISDTGMQGPGQPAVCYGLRGLCGVQIDVKGAKSDLTFRLIRRRGSKPTSCDCRVTRIIPRQRRNDCSGRFLRQCASFK